MYIHILPLPSYFQAMESTLFILYYELTCRLGYQHLTSRPPGLLRLTIFVLIGSSFTPRIITYIYRISYMRVSPTCIYVPPRASAPTFDVEGRAARCLQQHQMTQTTTGQPRRNYGFAMILYTQCGTDRTCHPFLVFSFIRYSRIVYFPEG